MRAAARSSWTNSAHPSNECRAIDSSKRPQFWGCCCDAECLRSATGWRFGVLAHISIPTFCALRDAASTAASLIGR
ncbi:hypothetical protein C6V04_09900 [Burkholderia multivorans]|nr:hypothetical protein C6P86_26170 [Burkholderia multivorans]PRE91091.1 hypothetical protein C6Q00_02470 [Burkholderia multivorans]PRG22263.1 hypothetical protein C6T57_14245 [Burkholderia multivorans]PRG94623.1 hypothetical protein C6V04_09900 [Burkholderia multivorans]